MKTDTGRFSEDELQIAAQTDLLTLLEDLGYTVMRIGSYFTVKEMDSLRIKNRRMWFRYSEQIGGDAITFLQHFQGMSFTEAVEYLLDRDHAAPVRFIQQSPAEAPVQTFTLPEPNSDNRRVFAYLRKRGIRRSKRTTESGLSTISPIIMRRS